MGALIIDYDDVIGTASPSILETRIIQLQNDLAEERRAHKNTRDELAVKTVELIKYKKIVDDAVERTSRVVNDLIAQLTIRSALKFTDREKKFNNSQTEAAA